MFTEQLPDRDYINNFLGPVYVVDNINIHYDNAIHSLTKLTLITVSFYNFVQPINQPTCKCGHITDWVVLQPSMKSIKSILLQIHLNHLNTTLNPTSKFLSLSLLPYTRLLGILQTLIIHQLLLNFSTFQSFHLLNM